MLFDEFDQPTVLFYGLVLGVVGLLFVVISKFFSKKKKHNCQTTHKTFAQGGRCFDNSGRELLNVDLEQCCADFGKKHKHTWKDLSHLATDCTGSWDYSNGGQCVQTPGATDNCLGKVYKQFRMERPARYGGTCEANDNEIVSELCVLDTCGGSPPRDTITPVTITPVTITPVTTTPVPAVLTCPSAEYKPVCDKFGHNIFVATNECMARDVEGIFEYQLCDNSNGFTMCNTQHDPVCDAQGNEIATNECDAKRRGLENFVPCV